MNAGTFTYKFKNFRIQLYWPYFIYKREKSQDRNHWEFGIYVDNAFRVVIDTGKLKYFGFGFQILGLGVGVDYYEEMAS
jgi:hypothetical protein